MKTQKQKIHYTDSYLISPTNAVTVNLIGAGGTGSQVLTALARMDCAMTQLGHPGLSVRLWDDDTVSEANLGRQLFAECELGMYKVYALINRVNRFFGTDWKAERMRFERNAKGMMPDSANANIFISCVDNVKARFGIAEMLQEMTRRRNDRNAAKYWLDFGNSKSSGQAILATIGNINQPKSEKYITVANLPFVTEEFGELLRLSETTDDTPSCSLAEALEKQDLFINSALAQWGCSLLWSLFRNGMTDKRGFFLNLDEYRSQPLGLPDR